MDGTAVPLYIKHNDLPNGVGTTIPLELCRMFNVHIPDQTLGAQLIKGIWTIWVKSIRAKQFIMEQVKVLCINYIDVDIYDKYPSLQNIPNEKILFKDLPLHVKDSEILDFLSKQPGINVRSKVIASRIRDDSNRLTPFYSGDRFVFVKGKFTPALHRNALVNNNKCRIWHKTQEEACERCRNFDHVTHDTDKCDAFTEDSNDVIAFRSPKHVLCNYYPAYIKVYDMVFHSVEQAYQWRFLKYIGMEEQAQLVLDTRSAAHAKEIASSIPRQLHKDWHAIKLCVMKDILHAKADYCAQFKKALIDSVGKRLVESTQDLFWASGLSPNLSATTTPTYYPGSNELGRILEAVRADLIKEAMLLSLVDTTDFDHIPSSPVDDLNTTTSAEDNEKIDTIEPPPTGDTAVFDLLATSPTPEQQAITEDTLEQLFRSEQAPPTEDASVSKEQSPEEQLNTPQATKLEQVSAVVSHSNPQITPVSTQPPSKKKQLKADKTQTRKKVTTVDQNPRVLAMFEALKKRKMSPEKEADNSQKDSKLVCRSSHNS